MSEPIVISEDNLSIAWAKALQEVKKDQTRPLCISITDFAEGVIAEDQNIRSSLDALLKRKGLVSARETSETIFPYHYWSLKQPDAEDLFSWYFEKYLPRHRARARKITSNITTETYFERLMAYRGYEEEGDALKPITVNQLQRIINVFKHYNKMGRSPSPSKYIATCLNPSTDNTNMSPYVSFPCLQQVGFSMAGGVVTVSGFYTIQLLMKRGYGNYLGLCYLGQFMSKETGLPLARVNCFVGNPRVDDFSQTDLAPIFDAIPAAD